MSEKIRYTVKDEAVVIARARKPRSGWAEAAKRLRARDADRLLEPPIPTRFDDEEWKW